MDEPIIKGIVYSQFHEKLGPAAIVWIPDDLSDKIRNLVSMKSMSILVGEGGQIPSALTIIPFPSISMKGLIKLLEIKDKTRRGGAIDSSITLLFSEVNDLIFYKYKTNFEEIFTESTAKIIKLEETKADPKQIEAELNKLYEKSIEILNELRDAEIAAPDAELIVKREEKPEIKAGFRFKVIVCGDPEVGKTSIILRFTNKAFKRTYIPTIGVNISEKQVFLEAINTRIEFIIWDIAGRGKFQRMRTHFYQGADGLLLVFDLTRLSTFKNVASWYQDVKASLHVDLMGFVLGNKSDLIDQRKVNAEESAILAQELKMDYIETSALSGENVDNAFYRLAAVLIAQRKAMKKEK